MRPNAKTPEQPMIATAREAAPRVFSISRDFTSSLFPSFQLILLTAIVLLPACRPSAHGRPVFWLIFNASRIASILSNRSSWPIPKYLKLVIRVSTRQFISSSPTQTPSIRFSNVFPTSLQAYILSIQFTTHHAHHNPRPQGRLISPSG